MNLEDIFRKWKSTGYTIISEQVQSRSTTQELSFEEVFLVDLQLKYEKHQAFLKGELIPWLVSQGLVYRHEAYWLIRMDLVLYMLS